MKPVNPGSHSQKSLAECNDISPLQESLNDDIIPGECEDRGSTLKDVGGPLKSLLIDASNKKVGIGQQANCDPMMTGQIVQDLKHPARNTIYRYSKAVRGCDEAVMDLFRNLVVIDEDGKAHPVPIIWATQERAVSWIIQDNLRRDNSVVVDRIRLPVLAIHSRDLAFNQQRYIYHKAIDYLRDEQGRPGAFINEGRHERDTVFGVARGLPVDISYTLYAWTGYVEDMNQILEQILLKFSPIAYISVRGVSWETIVKLESTANNLDVEPGDKNLRVVKFQFNLTAETYIPQPVIRKKAVLKTKVDIFDSTESEDISEVVTRLEEAVKGFTP